MALLKSIRQTDGVVTNYHRILFTQSTINSHNSIVVASYVDKEARNMELSEIRPYKITKTYEKHYVENMTVEDAYDYLKTLPQFEDAEDI
jgi:hypothetical protein